MPKKRRAPRKSKTKITYESFKKKSIDIIVLAEDGTTELARHSVNPDIIRKLSPIAETALDSEFKEGKNQELYWVEDPDTVVRLFGWLLDGGIHIEEDATQYSKIEKLEMLYDLALRREIIPLQDRLMDEIFYHIMTCAIQEPLDDPKEDEAQIQWNYYMSIWQDVPARRVWLVNNIPSHAKLYQLYVSLDAIFIESIEWTSDDDWLNPDLSEYILKVLKCSSETRVAKESGVRALNRDFWIQAVRDTNCEWHAHEPLGADQYCPATEHLGQFPIVSLRDGLPPDTTDSKKVE